MSDQSSERQAKSSRLSADPLSNRSAESRAEKKLKTLWQYGDLFHASARYPRKPKAKRVDRLAGILASGLLAPAQCRDGSVFSDLNITFTGSSVPYDSLVFLHRFSTLSYIYIPCEPGRFAVMVDPGIPVLTPESLAPNWVLLCQDEVYARDSVALEKLIGVAVHAADADAVLSEFIEDFRRLEIPLYDFEGTVMWPVLAGTEAE